MTGRYEALPGEPARPATAELQVPATTADLAVAGVPVPLSQRCHDCYEFGHEECGCGECGAAYCGRSDDSPQEATYQESLLEGADPDEGFHE